MPPRLFETDPTCLNRISNSPLKVARTYFIEESQLNIDIALFREKATCSGMFFGSGYLQLKGGYPLPSPFATLDFNQHIIKVETSDLNDRGLYEI